jgi:hypothetical protein
MAIFSCGTIVVADVDDDGIGGADVVEAAEGIVLAPLVLLLDEGRLVMILSLLAEKGFLFATISPD